jgi:hypothetical protein
LREAIESAAICLGKPLGLGENMSSMLFWRYCFSVMLCFFALAGMQPVNVGGTTRQDAEPKASPEMNRLKKLYLGTWDYTETYEKTPFYPQGGSDTGVYTSELGPGGNSIVNQFQASQRDTGFRGGKDRQRRIHRNRGFARSADDAGRREETAVKSYRVNKGGGKNS